MSANAPANAAIPERPRRPRRPLAQRRFLARVDAPAGSSCVYAVITVNAAARVLISRRRQLFEDAQRADPAIEELRFGGDGLALYFDDESTPGDPDGDYSELPARTRVREDVAVRTDCNAMVIEAEGVSWAAGPAHEDGFAKTRTIAYAVLLGEGT